MKTQSAKAKGRKLQKMVAETILKVCPFLQEDDVVSRPMGSQGEDIMLSPKARQWCPLSFECKNTKTFPSIAGLDQAKANCKGHLPAVCWKPPGKGKEDIIIYFRLEELLEWIKMERMNG